MNRVEIWAFAMLLGAVVAVVDLFTGWTVNGGPAAIVVVLVLLGGSFTLFAFMLIAVISDRRAIVGHSLVARSVLARAARGVRWSSLFATGFSVLLFANCSGGSGTSGPAAQVSGPPPGQAGLPVTSSGPATLVSGPLQDPAHFWMLTAWILAPLLLALLAPTVLTFAAERLATSRPRAARTLSFVALWSMLAVAAAALTSVLISYIVGLNSCLEGPVNGSAGYCAAGFGGFMSPLSIGTLALFLPYLLLIPGAIVQMQSDRSK